MIAEERTALRDEVRTLADRILAELRAGEDYYEHTKLAWRVLQELSREALPLEY